MLSAIIGHRVARRRFLRAAAFVFIVQTIAATNARSAANDDGSHPRLGIALSAGAARGLAHVGVLKAFEENDIEIDCIAGTSMGAVIGALYASGYSTGEIENIVLSVDWRGVFSHTPERALVPLAQRIDMTPVLARIGVDSMKVQLPRSVESDYRINRLLTKLLAAPELAIGNDFDRLPIPFRAVAADLRTGERVVLAGGSLRRAVRASLSIPVRLVPVEDGNRLLVDGGMVDALPIGVAREMDADIVIGVDTRLEPLGPHQYRDVIGMAAKLVEVLARSHNAAFTQTADITITPNLEGIGPLDYESAERVMGLGYESGRNAIEAIRRRIGEESDGGRPRNGAAPDSLRGSNEGYVIEGIRVEGNRHVKEKLVEEIFELRRGDSFDLDQVLRGIDALHASRLFDSIWLDFDRVGSKGLVVTIYVSESWRSTIELGAAFNEADHASGFLRFRTRNLGGWSENFDVTGMASESRVEGRAQITGNLLFNPIIGFFARGYVFEEKPRVFADGEQEGRAKFDVSGAALGLQRQIGHTGLLRAGGGIERITTRIQPGVDFTVSRERIPNIHALAVWDRLDDRTFPASGQAARVWVEWSHLHGRDTPLSHDYRRAIGSARGALSIGKRNIVDAEIYAAGSSGGLPPYKLFRIGGPLVPGLYRDELWGAQAFAGGIGHSFILWRDLRLTARFGAGNVWTAREEIALRSLRTGFGLAIETPTRAGPISFGYGRGDGDVSHFYLAAGYQHDRPE